jgi:hypothetical protein
MARRARFCRATKTRIWGRERPPKTGGRDRDRGVAEGSLTPQMPTSLLLTGAPTATRAATSAALYPRAKLLIVSNVAKRDMPSRSLGPRVGQTKYAIDAGGPLLPGLWSPRLSSLLCFLPGSRGARSRTESAVEKQTGASPYEASSTAAHVPL